MLLSFILVVSKSESILASSDDLEKIQIKNVLLPKEYSEPRQSPITHVVLHFTSNAAAKFRDPYRFEEILDIFIEYGVSVHYMIGRKGEVYRLIPENRVAYHAGKGELPGFPKYKDRLNDFSIGIELMGIGTKAEMRTVIPDFIYDFIDPRKIGYTDAQYDTLCQLLEDILVRNSNILRDKNHIIGHDEYAVNRKVDPGSMFDWSRIGL
ncbi:N-acetylmuramoyl-L-alanine amidase [Oceanobacillus senegalensis]|uniref:N-acetylmuramoyl-L-alanine amidase n=1 Tax=Oceanobacillus senegalensis TaxID=1936063 RepID=UPI001C4F4BA2|nr:N-acetylmuramoyl-L-alanine amidase [Oceanobacillus senegalensis]